jgi:GT2 family glycosyltransferase
MAMRISAVSANHSGALVSSRLTGFELKLSIVVPVYEAGAALGYCLQALNGNADAAEVLVVDDGSTEDSAATCRSAGARLIPMKTNQGAAAARNAGVRAASGDYVVFVDADVVLHPHALRRIRETIQSNPQWSAFFGSYDDTPADKGLVGQYRNLLHHYTHQRTASPAPHFWTGIGVIKRQDFWRVGGFDETLRHLEDVELGSRLNRAGLVIHVVPDLLGMHLKRYTLLSMIRTDLIQRAIPWALLLRAGRIPHNKFVTSSAQMLSAAGTSLMLVSVPVAFALSGLLGAAMACAGALIFAAVNSDFANFLRAKRGVVFLLACIPLHLIHTTCALAGAGLVAAGYRTREQQAR